MTKKRKEILKMGRILLKILTVLIISVSIIGCSSTKEAETKTAETVFNEAMKYYNDENYIEAEKLFDVFKLQYPASQYTDDAQYYLGECNYKRGQYILASYNYNSVRRYYPHSEFIKESAFKAALCYYNLSPSYDRDQEYTAKAVQALSEFQTLYPGDSLYNKASGYINELRDKLGKREFFTAELYRKMFSPMSALIYYDFVINNYTDTQYYEPAYFGKIEVLVEMQKQLEASAAIDSYKKLFPKGGNIDKVKEIEKRMGK